MALAIVVDVPVDPVLVEETVPLGDVPGDRGEERGGELWHATATSAAPVTTTTARPTSTTQECPRSARQATTPLEGSVTEHASRPQTPALGHAPSN
jgi:hypothetical protein